MLFSYCLSSEMQKSYINTGYSGVSGFGMQKSYINTGYSGISGFSAPMTSRSKMWSKVMAKPEIPE